MSKLELTAAQAFEILEKAKELVRAEQKVDWYDIVVQLLKSYKGCKHRVEALDEYGFEPTEHDKSISVAPQPNTGIKDRMDIKDEIIEERKKSYARTYAQFQELDTLVRMFNGRPEFKVIRMYYFNEDKNGNDLEPGVYNKMEDIALELYADVKTVRRWRSNIIQEMAVVLGGVDAAVSVSVHNTARKSKDANRKRDDEQ